MADEYNTGNPLGSNSLKDLSDNAIHFDLAMNSPQPSFKDRFGLRRETWAGMEALFTNKLAGLGLAYAGEYAAGLQINSRMQYVVRDGQRYMLKDGVTLPYTLNGNWGSEQSLFLLLRQPAGFSDVRAFGAVGDGTADDAAAFLDADSSTGMVYVPAGTYLIKGTVALSSMVFFEKGAIIKPDSSAKITFNGELYAAKAKIFASQGSIILGKEVSQGYPEWFGADDSGADGAAINRCIQACRPNSVKVIFSGKSYYVEANQVIKLYPDNQVDSDPFSQLAGVGATNGIQFEPGNYTGKKYRLPRIAQFPGDALVLRGANLIDIELPSIQLVGNGVVCRAEAADANTVLDNKVTCHVISQCSQNAIVISGDAANNVLQGNEFYVNFSTSNLRTVLFVASGSADPNWDGHKFQFQAIDPTPNIPTAACLAAVSTNAVPKVVFRCETWMGGLPADGSLVIGKFNGLDFFANFNEGIQNYAAWQLVGVGNKITTGFRGFGLQNDPLTLSNAANARDTWNGGVALSYNKVRCRINLGASVAANATVIAYLYHPFAASQNFLLTPQSMNGFVVQAIATSANANEIAVTVLNVSGAAKPAGSLIDFVLEVG